MASDPKQPQPRLGGHHSDFDELSWHLTYRAAKVAQDEHLPQSEAEARFVQQMLGNQPIESATFPFATPGTETVKPQSATATAHKNTRLGIGLLVALFILIPIISWFYLGITGDNSEMASPVPTSPTVPVAPPVEPSYEEPTDKTAEEVISEMLAAAAEVNPGIMWFTDTQPTLQTCIYGYKTEGQTGYLNVRWGMGDFDAIPTNDMTEANRQFHVILSANDRADNAMIEAWIGQEMDTNALTRFSIDPHKGNWNFGAVYPGLQSGAIFFDEGVGVLQLQTKCLRASTPPAKTEAE